MGTGPWDPTRAGNRFLASDADRDRAIEALKTAFVHGVLTTDELGVRTGQALASRTYGELAALTAGLNPSAPSAPSSPRPLGPGKTPPQPYPPAAARAWKRVNKKVLAWTACALVLPFVLGATFLSYYGGFLVMFLFTFIGAVLTSRPPSPRRPGRPGLKGLSDLASSMGWLASTSKPSPAPPTTPTAEPRRGPSRRGTRSPPPSSKAGGPRYPPSATRVTLP
jgi:hypothetical protein